MLYHFVGPRAIANRCGPPPRGTPIASPEDVLRWVASNTEGPLVAVEVTVTFVVSEAGTLLIADRHSEHVACAGTRPVRTAGEICFAVHGDAVTVTRISNQSTGYCPEPESWADVVGALRGAGLGPTDGFDPRCEFRRCPKCAALNLVKHAVFECGVCEAELPREYNCQSR
ncbi:hypothetical protein J8F10_18310 [Gemmata sp. G18]|uniref:Uncharacterized protein n=1 Tax=Gemmata palustris TaxID=2822762 RepID=A0ABS5BU11_9BACT|nr:hypothetical protein [Gemmata palustris]MBP3957219.1 hypothetical protein [Gemmata palustris]